MERAGQHFNHFIITEVRSEKRRRHKNAKWKYANEIGHKWIKTSRRHNKRAGLQEGEEERRRRVAELEQS